MLYQLETMQVDNADKIGEEEKAIITKLIEEGTALKNNPDTTKDQFEAEFTKYQEEMMKLYQKFGATNNAANPDSADVIENDAPAGEPEGQVIDTE
jgi:hypothetical protein